MSNKIFETDSDLEIEEPAVEAVESSEPAPTAPKVKTKTKTKVLDPEDDNTIEVKTDELGEPKKQRKKRPPLTEERKAQLLANLQKGRQKALENRQKKAQVKKIIKKKKEEEMDTLIQQDLVAKKSQASEKNKLRDDLDEMKLMMKKLMDENNKLKSKEPNLSPINEEPPASKSAPAPAPAPKSAPAPTPAPQRRNHISKGIKSRWDKYKN